MGVVVAVLGILVVWLALLTASVLRWRRERGEPVYRRLPDGRLRFEWSVANAYQSVRHAGPPRAGPAPVDTPRARGRAIHDVPR